MLTLRNSLVLTSLAAFALCSASPDAVKLARKPKVGDKHEYKTDLVLETMGIEINVSHTINDKVLKVNKDGSFVLEETQTDVAITVAGMAQEAPPEASGELTYSKSGEVTKIVADQSDPDALSMANVMILLWPTKAVDVGSTWKADSKTGGVISHSYKVLAREKVKGHDTFKISMTAESSSSDGPAGKGVMWVDVTNGMTVKAEGEMTNVIAGGMIMDSVSYSVTIVK